MVRSVLLTPCGMWRVTIGRQHMLADVMMYIDIVV